MHSFKPASIDYGSLVLNVYVDASFASGGGRSRSGLAMYLVNPKNGNRESDTMGLTKTDFNGHFSTRSGGLCNGRGLCHFYISL